MVEKSALDQLHWCTAIQEDCTVMKRFEAVSSPGGRYPALFYIL